MPLEVICVVNKGRHHVRVLASPERVYKCRALLLRGCSIAVAYVHIAGCIHDCRCTCRPTARLLALLCASCIDTDTVRIDLKGFYCCMA